MKVLFICKIREYDDYGDYNDWGYGYGHGGSGLYTSAKLVSAMLNSIGIKSKVIRVVDNNDIDREVTKYKPTHVVIEAIWVVPEKFKILNQLHPQVTWIVRIHSEIPFLANEGIAMDWLFKYYNDGIVDISTNSKRIKEALIGLGFEVLYLPNYYPIDLTPTPHKRPGSTINIGCFGAIRPLKNQLMQAIAAIIFADNNQFHLRFHINSDRIEQKGSEPLKNIRDLFIHANAELVEHKWMSHRRFLKLLKQMDVGMNLSLSETYSVITADYVASNLPIVVSPEVQWVSDESKANPNDIGDIIGKLNACFDDSLILSNKYLLNLYSVLSKIEWKNYFGV